MHCCPLYSKSTNRPTPPKTSWFRKSLSPTGSPSAQSAFKTNVSQLNGLDEKRLALFLRYQTTHGGAFHKFLCTLIRLKKDRVRGFVSQPESRAQNDFGFVSQNAEPDRFVPQEYVESGPCQPAKVKLESLKAA
jgi:hypothetical protein